MCAKQAIIGCTRDDSSFLIKDFIQVENAKDFQLDGMNGNYIKDSSLSDIEKMMYLDSISYLPDDFNSNHRNSHEQVKTRRSRRSSLTS